MAHEITPLGKWRKEVSWNDPNVMFAPDGGHTNNQITPEDYVMEREIDSNGETVLNLDTIDPQKVGKIDPKKFVNKLKMVMSDNYYNMDYEQKLQLLASEKPSVGGFFDMGASMQLDDMIKVAKANGQMDVHNNFQQPVAGSQIQIAQQGQQLMSTMTSNMNRLKMGATAPRQVIAQQVDAQHQQTIQPQRQLIPERTVQRPKIKANREQLKNLIAQKQQSSNMAQNPYAKKGR